MKRKLLFPVILFLQIVLFASPAISSPLNAKLTDDTDDAIEYNDKMIAIQIEVDNCLVYLLDAIETGKKFIIKGAIKECNISIKQAKKDIKKMGDFQGDDEYQLKMLDLIAMYEDLIKTEISDIIDLALNEEELSDEDFESYYNLYDKALVKYDEGFAEFFEFQYKFADKYGFTIEGDEY